MSDTPPNNTGYVQVCYDDGNGNPIPVTNSQGLPTTGGGGGGGGNVVITSPIGQKVSASSLSVALANDGLGATSGSALYVQGSLSSSNLAVLPVGSSTFNYATVLGYANGSSSLTPVGNNNPLPESLQSYGTINVTATSSALNGFVVPWTNVEGLSSFALQLTGTSSQSITFYGSNDPTFTNKQTIVATTSQYIPSNASFFSNLTISGTVDYNVIGSTFGFKYISVQSATYVSGSLTGNCEISTRPFFPSVTPINGVVQTSTLASPLSLAAFTAANQAVVVSDSLYSLSSFGVIAGNFTNFSFLFEASIDAGTNYYPLAFVNQSTGKAYPGGLSGVLTNGAKQSFEVPLGGVNSVRITCLTIGAGTTATMQLVSTGDGIDPLVTSFLVGSDGNILTSTAITSQVESQTITATNSTSPATITIPATTVGAGGTFNITLGDSASTVRTSAAAVAAIGSTSNISVSGSTPVADSQFSYVCGATALYKMNVAADTINSFIGTVTGNSGIAISPNKATIYVAEYGGGLHIVDAASFTLTTTLTASGLSNIQNLAVSPDGTKIYACSSNTVVVVAIPGNTVSSVITGLSSAYSVAFSPDGTKAYVANFGNNTVGIIDATSDTLVSSINLGAESIGIAFNPDGLHAYAALYNNAQVAVIDTVALTFTTVSVGANPISIAVTPDGSKAYVCNRSSNNVSVISTSSNTVVATPSVGGSPYGLGISAGGNKVYVANNTGNSVSVISTATNTVIDTINSVTAPGGAVFSAVTPVSGSYTVGFIGALATQEVGQFTTSSPGWSTTLNQPFEATDQALDVNLRSLTLPIGVSLPVSAATLPLPAGASTSALQTTGNTSLASIAANTANAGLPTPSPSSSTAALIPVLTTALTNTAVAIKASTGRVYYYHIYNPNVTGAFIQFYNVAAGSVTVGTTAAQRILFIPAGGVLDTPITIPWSFSTAISYAATTTATGGTALSTAILANVDVI